MLQQDDVKVKAEDAVTRWMLITGHDLDDEDFESLIQELVVEFCD